MGARPEAGTKAARRVLAFGLVTGLIVGPERCLAAPTAVDGNSAIEEALCADGRRARPWNETWAGLFVLTAIGSASLATWNPRGWLDDDERAGFYVTSVKASLGALAKIIDPLEIQAGGACAESHDLPAAMNKQLLAEAARRERLALLPNIVGGLVLNALGLLYLGYGRDAWSNAWISFGTGSAVSIATVLTAPFDSWRLERRLDRAHDVAAVPVIGGGATGVALTGTW